MNNFSSARGLADALWLFIAKARGGEHWVANSRCRIDVLNMDQQSWPVSILDSHASDESYVADPQSAWIRYPHAEILKSNPVPVLKPAISVLSHTALSPIAGLIRGSRLPHATILCNKLITTNLYPDWQGQQLLQARQQLLDEYPERPIMLRNVCPALTPNLAADLLKQGWLLVPARMIYLCHATQPSVSAHDQVRQDKKLLHDRQVEILHPQQIQAHELPQLHRLFKNWFNAKQTQLNPNFTLAFFEMCLETSFLELHALRYQGKLCGILGIYDFLDENSQQHWITSPLIGYDRKASAQLGLYRRLMALLLEQAVTRNANLHYSSGAGSFKRSRGGIAHPEYCAIYGQHLPKFASACLSAFAYSMRLIAPNLPK